jgi:hypothetical protein
LENQQLGLEIVELMMHVEDRFGSSVLDAKFEQMLTVGDLHDFLMDRIRSQHADVCLSAAMFYRIRQILVDQFNVDRVKFRPATSLESLVGPESRQQFWRTIESTLAAKMPKLKRSKWLRFSGDMFPPECSTVGQLVGQCIDRNKLTDEFGSNDHEAVFETVQRLVAVVAGVDEKKISRGTSFVHDLGF